MPSGDDVGRGDMRVVGRLAAALGSAVPARPARSQRKLVVQAGWRLTVGQAFDRGSGVGCSSPFGNVSRPRCWCSGLRVVSGLQLLTGCCCVERASSRAGGAACSCCSACFALGPGAGGTGSGDTGTHARGDAWEVVHHRASSGLEGARLQQHLRLRLQAHMLAQGSCGRAAAEGCRPVACGGGAGGSAVLWKAAAKHGRANVLSRQGMPTACCGALQQPGPGRSCSMCMCCALAHLQVFCCNMLAWSRGTCDTSRLGCVAASSSAAPRQAGLELWLHRVSLTLPLPSLRLGTARIVPLHLRARQFENSEGTASSSRPA